VIKQKVALPISNDNNLISNINRSYNFEIMKEKNKNWKPSENARTRRRVSMRQGKADNNALERAKRSNKEQIQELDRRLGEGVGAERERKRLAA
jgi:hypothetical protein